MTAAPPFPELQEAVNQMNMGKAPGDDGVTTEMLRWAPGLLNLIFSPWFKNFGTILSRFPATPL